MAGKANQRLVDALVRHQTFLVGHAKNVSAKVRAALDATSPEMRKHLLETFAANDTENQTIKKLRAAEAKLFGIRMPGWNDAREKLIDALVELAQHEPKFLAGTVARIREGIGEILLSPTAERLRAIVSRALIAGRTLLEQFKSAASADLARISGQTRIGYFARETASKIAARVLGTAKVLSPALTAAANAVDTLVSTAVHAVASAARELAISENTRKGGFGDLELWVSILDNRTTQGCIHLNGKIFPIGVGIQPGYHYHCRSDRVPYLEGEEPPNPLTTFADWVETQGAKFKKFVGNTKTFLRTGIQPLTLKEVDTLDKETFE